MKGGRPGLLDIDSAAAAHNANVEFMCHPARAFEFNARVNLEILSIDAELGIPIVPSVGVDSGLGHREK